MTNFNPDGSPKLVRKIPDITKRKRMRNLVQYQDMPEKEFDALIEKKEVSLEKSREFENRIEKKLKDFEQDYDLNDLKINDKETLRALIQAVIALEDYEQHLSILRLGGINEENIYLFEKINKVMSDLRKDISNFQDDLKITRKARKSDTETSVIAYIEGLKEKVKKFYESRMNYVFCDRCKELLGTFWFLYPNANNTIILVCNREVDGNICGTKTKITSKEMLAKGNSNHSEFMPERM